MPVTNNSQPLVSRLKNHTVYLAGIVIVVQDAESPLWQTRWVGLITC
jgi:hypothetical protein